MKKFLMLSLAVLVLNCIRVEAQNHFIYIQSEAKKAFTVSVNDKKYTSTETGYVIIPRLKSGEYNLLVNYKNEPTASSRFTSVIERKDLGYTLKDVSPSNVALVDMQTYATLSALPNDSYAKNDKPAEGSTPVTKTPPNDKAVKSSTTKSTTAKSTSVNPATAKLKKGVNKISEVQEDNNISLLFIDVTGTSSDTIDVLIPVQKEESYKPSMYGYPHENTLFIWASNDSYNASSDPEYQTGYNTKCVHLLTKEDFARLRRKMSSESSEDNMIGEAVKVSKIKCFTTSDVKKLSTLFRKEQGKLKFFDALYNNVYDYIDYPELEKELTDAALINKFKSLVQR